MIRKRSNRRSIRLPLYDYSQPGAYFVTIVTLQRVCLFDKPSLRRIAENAWLALPRRFDLLELDAWTIMPNHVHGILWISPGANCNGIEVDANGQDPTERPLKVKGAGSLGVMVGAFKSSVARAINATRNSLGEPVWQRNYYEHVVRDDRDLTRIRTYIEENPFGWAEDEYNPNRSDRR